MIEIRVLGPIEVLAENQREIKLAGSIEESLLAALVAAGPDGLEAPVLAPLIWPERSEGDEPTEAVHRAIADVNEALGRAAVVRSGDCWAVDASVVNVDAWRFEQMLRAAHAATKSPALADQWSDALGLWRGAPFESQSALALVRGEAARLDGLRADAYEAWFEERLAAGETSELVGDIDDAVDWFPRHEKLRAQHMTALANVGRGADAGKSFEEFRAGLTTIGREPSARLVFLDEELSRQDEMTLSAGAAPPRSARDAVDADGQQRVLVRGYELGERLGEGAFAVVFRATQESVGRTVAIKQIRQNLADQPEFIRQFEAEAHLVARIEHPHIVPLYDYWREPGSAFLVMRHLDGGSLADRLVEGPIDLEEVAALFGQIAAGLDEAHRSDVIHRDVKPANVLLDQLGNAYLSDFGIAVDEAERIDPNAWLSKGSPAYAAPEQLERKSIGPQADVYALGVSAYQSLTGRFPFPDETTRAGLLERQLNDPIPLVRATRAEIPAAVDTVLQRATAKDPNDRYPSAGAFAAELSRAAGLEGDDELVAPQDRNPYKGLQAFDEADAADFSGRSRLTTKLLDAVTNHRITAVVGPSGSGKSSVVRAGLIPAVRSGRLPGADRWFVTTMIPGTDPYGDLQAALLRVAVDPPHDLAARLRRDETGLAAMLDRIIPDGRQLLLAIDQFEELFTLSQSADRDRFVDALVHATTVGNPRLRVVLTIRADFYDHPLRHDAFARLIEDSTIAVHPLAADELERAIAEPAQAVGAAFEPGLIARITADVADQPGGLPLLQYALTELYDRRTGDTLTLAAYEQLGGVTGALARSAEELYDDSSLAEQEALRRSFGRLVTLGEGSEDTRRRVLRRELAASADADRAINRFGEARLLSFDREPATREPTVEVAHEALIREWPRLRNWLNEDRDGLRILRHITETSGAWQSRGRDIADLYRGGRLEAATDWATDNTGRLTTAEAEFLEASQTQHELEIAAEAKSRKRLQRLLVGVGAVAIIALIAGGLAFQQQGEAQKNQAAAETERMAADAASRVEENPQLALLLAAEAHKRDPGPVGLGALQETLANTGNFLGVIGAGNDYSVAGWIDDATIAAAGSSGIATYDITTGEQLTYVDLPIEDRVVDYGGDGSASPHPVAGFTKTHAVVVPTNNSCCLAFIDLVSGDVISSSVEHAPIWIDVHPGADAAATLDAQGFVRVFTVSSGELRWELHAHPEATAADFGLAAAETAAINKVTSRDIDLTVFPTNGGSVHFSPDGKEVLSTRIVQRFWATDNGETTRPEVFEPLDEDGRSKSSRTNFVTFQGDQIDVIAGEYDIYGPSGRVEIATTGAFYGLPDAFAFRRLADDRLLVQFSDRRLGFLDPSTGLLTGDALKLGLPEPGRFVVSPGESLVALPSADGVGIWSLDGDQLLSKSFPRHGAKIGTINSSGTRFTAADNAYMHLPWFDAPQQHVEVSTGEQLPVDAWDREYITGYFVGSPVMITFGRDFRSRSYDPNTNQVVGEFDLLGFGALEHSADGLAAYGVQLGGGAFGFAIFNRAGEPITTVETNGFMTSGSFSPDGGRLTGASQDGAGFTVWDTETWEVVHDASAIEGQVRVASYSADGRYLLTIDEIGAISLRDPDTLKPIRQLLGSRGGAFLNVDMAFSNDGRYLLYGGADDIRLWDLEEGAQIGSVFPNEPDFNFGPNNGPQLLTAVGEHLLVWNLDMTTWFDIACQAAGRNLTPSEWQQFGPTGESYGATCPQWPTLE